MVCVITNRVKVLVYKDYLFIYLFIYVFIVVLNQKTLLRR